MSEEIVKMSPKGQLVVPKTSEIKPNLIPQTDS